MENKEQIRLESQYVTPDQFQSKGCEEEQKKMTIGMISGVVLMGVLTVAFIIYLMTAPASMTARIRDIFIIFLALQSLLIGVVLIILIIQVAKLTNLLQNEIKPILDSTNETVSNLRGTTMFLSDNLVEPVMKANEYTASLRQLLATIGLVRGVSKRNDK